MIRLAIRRPVATLTTAGALAAVGLASLFRMAVEVLPDVELPRVEVHVSWPGTSPEMVEAFVTAPVEAAAQTVRGVESVASTSYPARASVTVEFARGTDVEFARLELAERLAALTPDLPPGIEGPVVEPYVPEEFADEAQALLGYSLAGPWTLGGLRELALERVEPAIRAVEGVDAVEVVGGTGRELRVELDSERLVAHGLAPADVRRAIAAGLNVSEAGATFRRRDLEWTIAIDDRAVGARDVEALVLRPATAGGPPLRLGDMARVVLDYADPHVHYRVDGAPAVSLFVYSEEGTNAMRVADRVRGRIVELARALPTGFRLIEDHDRTEAIRTELGSLRDRALIAAAVVFLVLVGAFRRVAFAALAFGSIAGSVLIAAVFLWAGGISLNLLTMAGLAMGLGLAVDNAIVALEAIERRRAGGESPSEAAPAGTRQVALPILAATATTLVVFVPFLYAQGELRAYYVPFAWTVAAILAASVGLALTAVPALAARIGRETCPRHSGSRVAERPPTRRAARTVLGWTLRHPKLTVGAAFAALALSGWLFWEYVARGRVWDPLEEESYLSIQIEMPRGSELDHTDAVVRRVEEKLDRIRGIEGHVARVHPEYAYIRVTFPDSLDTTSVPAAIKERLIAHSRGFDGAEVRVYGFGPSFYGGGGGPPSYSLKLLGYDYRELERLALDLASRLRRLPRIRDVDPNASGTWYERDKETELVLAPDRLRLAAHGLSVAEFIDRATAAIPGRIARDVVEVAGEEVPLAVKLENAEEADVEELLAAVVAGPSVGPVRMADVAQVHPRETLGRIIREDQQYQRVVAWEFRGPPKLGDRVRDAVVAETVLPPGYEIEMERSWWEYDGGETRQLVLVVALALTLVYLVTAALFESLRSPLVVLAAVPQALIGVFVLYWVLDETFTREAWIGVVMMSGIVVNNAIIIVDRIGALARGADGRPLAPRDAALEGTLERVRPVLMTTATTVLGLLPLIVATGEGPSTLWRGMALSTIGGLAASTLFVVTTIPALYATVMSRKRTERDDPAAPANRFQTPAA